MPAWGMTLRNRQRAYYYEQLDRLFPRLREKYEQAYGEWYSAGSPYASRLECAFEELAAKYGLERTVQPYCQRGTEQLRLF